jgi:nucleotide-binding universal stress UspA family protein
MMPSTVVVPVDGSTLSERALCVARPLARRLGAQLTIMCKPWFGGAETAESYVESLVREHPTGEPREEALVVDGLGAADAIRKVAEERAPAVLCMTTHGRGRLRWATAGSVAEDVIHESTAPLILVGPWGGDDWPESARRVVVCVDGASSDRPLIEHACAWARALDLEVEMVSVFHPLDAEVAHAERIFGPLVGIAKGCGIEVDTCEVLRSSFVAGALADFAEDDGVSLLVMAAHHHSSIARLTLGSTTMATVHLAPCPVLVVPPAAT